MPLDVVGDDRELQTKRGSGSMLPYASCGRLMAGRKNDLVEFPGWGTEGGSTS
jgi:hypothetical protein